MTSAVKLMLAEHRENMRAEFSVRFQDSKLAEAKIEPIIKDVAQLHTRTNEVEAYAHTWRHKHANVLQRLLLKTGVDHPDDDL